MKRRKIMYRLTQAVSILVLFMLAGAIPCWSQGREVRVGVLTPGLNHDLVFHGLVEGLERFGFRAERTVSFIVEDTQGGSSGLAGRVKRLLNANPDALFTASTSHALAAKRATSKVPIVFAGVADPVQAGLIAGYQSSGNNLTGVATYAGPLTAKRLEVLKEVAPRTISVLMLIPPDDVAARVSLAVAVNAAERLRLQIVRREVSSRADIEKALTDTPKGSLDAIFNLPSVLVGSNVDLVIRKAREDRIPLAVGNESIVTRGALFSYGADFRLAGTQAARILVKVLKGERPSDIPAEVPEKFSLVVNMATAKTIGLKITRNFLEKVDRVVE
jgi:putative ABC transport system substrate-binding protein